MLKRQGQKSKVMQKQIPTIVGLLILVVALIAGLLVFGDGTGVFAPRATAESTPKNIRLTNISHDSFTVTFFTEEATAGFIKYGVEPGKLNTQVRDDRDQLSGSIDDFKLHHITVRGLEPETQYYFVLGTGTRSEFDQEGQPFQLTTATTPSSSAPEAITVFGSVALPNGAPAQGSIVFVTAPGMQDTSSLVKGSGSWAIPLSQVLNAEGTDFANLTDEDTITLLVQGLSPDERIQQQLLVADAQPVELVFGQDASIVSDPMAEEIIDDEELTEDSLEATPSAELAETETPEATASAEEETAVGGHLRELLEEAEPLAPESTASSELLIGDLKEDPEEIVYTNQSPVIKGKVAPNVEVKIQVHSENRYEETVFTNDVGEFELDLSALQAELEPGEHTVTYSYIDPDTGMEVVKTEFFWVEDSEQVSLAMADTTRTADTTGTTGTTTGPHGTGDPYPMPSPTPTPVSATTTATPTIAPATATAATDAAREHVISTDSAAYKAGSVGATTLMLLSGVFLILIGSWSWWLAGELEQ